MRQMPRRYTIDYTSLADRRHTSRADCAVGIKQRSLIACVCAVQSSRAEQYNLSCNESQTKLHVTNRFMCKTKQKKQVMNIEAVFCTRISSKIKAIVSAVSVVSCTRNYEKFSCVQHKSVRHYNSVVTILSLSAWSLCCLWHHRQ